ncbi:MAG TPA: hypothetical protein VG206_27950 [Terriglobia bacterium]|nr:hypothetical protein [Terriglobia bacterium]
MSAKRTQARAAKTADETLLNAVARTVGSTLGTIVAKTESVIEKRGEVLEGLKARAAEAVVTKPLVTKPRRAATPPQKARPARKKAAPKKAASKKRATARASRRETSR